MHADHVGEVLRLGQRVAEFTSAEATVEKLVGAMTGALQLSSATKAKLEAAGAGL